MAIWQFQFSLVPILGIRRVHGKVVTKLPEYATRDPDAPVKELSEFNNYWEDFDFSSDSVKSLQNLLPTKPSWSEDAKMFGSNEGDSIEVWDDDIECSIDVRNLNIPLLSAIVQIANDMQCKIILKDGGRLVDPDIQNVITELENSPATKFVLNPIEFIKNRE